MTAQHPNKYFQRALQAHLDQDDLEFALAHQGINQEQYQELRQLVAEQDVPCDLPSCHCPRNRRHKYFNTGRRSR